MRRYTVFVAMLAVVVLIAAANVLLSAQTSAPDGLAALLAEVRGIRAEINQAAGASMRMQLLLARLTLQEQRIGALARQLTDVQGELTRTIEQRTDAERMYKTTASAVEGGDMPLEVRREIERSLPEFKRQLNASIEQEGRIRAQESELQSLLAAEQGRWLEFNNRLDELERALP